MKHAVTFFMAVMLLLLCACGAPASYRDDVETDAVARAIDDVIPGLTAMNEAYLKGAMKLDTSLFSEFTVKLSAAGTTIDEYGVFKADSPDSVSMAAKAAEDYILFRKDTWMPEYMPEERPKLDYARVRTMGLYVVYVISGEAERDAAMDAAEAVLKK